MSRNWFFRNPRFILHRKTSHCTLLMNRQTGKSLLSKVTQICPNFSLMTSYRKLTWFSDNGTSFFELSVLFYIRKHLLDNHTKRWETSVVICNHALNFRKSPKSENVPQMTSSGPTLSSSPKFAFWKRSKKPQFQTRINQPKSNILYAFLFVEFVWPRTFNLANKNMPKFGRGLPL